MDDLTFSARRASTGTVKPEPADLETRFRSLVQSPLRAGLLRYLSARPDEGFDVESLMQTFGRLKLDVQNCVKELADFGVVRPVADSLFTLAPAKVSQARGSAAAGAPAGEWGLVAFGWLLAGIPICWGVYRTLTLVRQMFR